MSRNTLRASPSDLAIERVARSKPSGVRRNVIEQQQRRMKKVKRVLGLVLLLPIGLITVLTFGEMLWRAIMRVQFWRAEEVIFFFVGGLAWAAAYVSGWRPVQPYVLGHEISHLIVARAFGGKIIDWGLTPTGGFVETNKSNTWITLAPYIMPFYTFIVLIIFGLVGMMTDLWLPHHVTLGQMTVAFKPVWFFYSALGLTWSFHLTFTVLTLTIQQSDLSRNGEFFSMMLIFLTNVLLLVALFLAASPAPELGVAEVIRCWLGTMGAVWQFIFGRMG